MAKAMTTKVSFPIHAHQQTSGQPLPAPRPRHNRSREKASFELLLNVRVLSIDSDQIVYVREDDRQVVEQTISRARGLVSRTTHTLGGSYWSTDALAYLKDL